LRQSDMLWTSEAVANTDCYPHVDSYPDPTLC